MISWTPGPPPVEWRDGRDVLVWRGDDIKVAVWLYDDMWAVEDWHFHESRVTHHAAVNAPCAGLTP